MLSVSTSLDATHSSASIQLTNVSVHFPVFQASARSMKRQAWRATVGGLIGSSPDTGRVTVQALNDISLRLQQGDRLALIGHNGSGKTTLLRVLAGIYHPTMGSVDAVGHRIPIFDIGLGVDLEATGLENIVTRGLVMGATRKEMLARQSEIAEFSELGGYLHIPMRTYSSGMVLRLLFSIATSIDGDILLMDEWFSVGDRQFIEKANKRFQELVDRTHILVLASHDLELLRRVCTTAAWLQSGSLKMYGQIDEVFAAYTAR